MSTSQQAPGPFDAPEYVHIRRALRLAAFAMLELYPAQQFEDYGYTGLELMLSDAWDTAKEQGKEGAK